jgi:hypothetical protein
MAGQKKQRSQGRTYSEGVITGLFFLFKYRFLTIAQFARISGFSAYHAAEVLRDFERWGHVGYFGNVLIPSSGKTPKVYYLKRKGFDILYSEITGLEELLTSFAEIHPEVTWSPQINHRLKIIDVLISAECAVVKRPHLRMANTFLSYRMIKKGAHVTRETTDYVDRSEISENKLVPDAAFILENIKTEKRALFFVELDMGTEQIVKRLTRQKQSSLRHKLEQYDRYLKSLRYTQTYAQYGEFRYFTMLLITTSDERVENIRRATADLPAQFANHYRFTTLDQAVGDFLGAVWKSRSFADTTVYPLVREE